MEYKRGTTNYKIKELLEQNNGGYTIQELVEISGYSISTVRRAVRKQGLKHLVEKEISNFELSHFYACHILERAGKFVTVSEFVEKLDIPMQTYYKLYKNLPDHLASKLVNKKTLGRIVPNKHHRDYFLTTGIDIVSIIESDAFSTDENCKKAILDFSDFVHERIGTYDGYRRT